MTKLWHPFDAGECELGPWAQDQKIHDILASNMQIYMQILCEGGGGVVPPPKAKWG